jgi:hypothetical protein
LAYTRSVIDVREFAPERVINPAKSVVTKPSLLRRLIDVMIESRQRQADREIAAYLRSTGGKFTDEAERMIEQRYLSGW